MTNLIAGHLERPHRHGDAVELLDLDLVRSDLREDQVGIPLTLNMTVLDSTTCQPLPNAAVDIWSANALGVYSDEASQGSSGSTFLRGVQVADANGAVQFTTLYPGWYTGRVNHIHMKVHIGGTRIPPIRRTACTPAREAAPRSWCCRVTQQRVSAAASR